MSSIPPSLSFFRKTHNASDTALDNFGGEFGDTANILISPRTSKFDWKCKDIAVLGVYFSLWYSLTILYNVTNKRVLLSFPLPAMVATIQLFLGLPLFIIPLWMKRQLRESLEFQHFKPYWKIAVMHGLGNIATTYSLGSSSVSFTHVVKAAEPVFSAGLSALILHSYLPTTSYLCLIPIVFGVAWASLAEASFTWLGFSTAMLSNLFYQFRNVLSKHELSRNHTPSEPLAAPPSPVQLFRVISLLAAVQMLPIAILLEGIKIPAAIRQLFAPTVNRSDFFLNLVVSGVSYYLYNEVAFRILNKVSPTTHAVGNALKRIVIIGAAALLLGSPMTSEGLVASSVAVAGTLLYSLSQTQGSPSRAVQFA